MKSINYGIIEGALKEKNMFKSYFTTLKKENRLNKEDLETLYSNIDDYFVKKDSGTRQVI